MYKTNATVNGVSITDHTGLQSRNDLVREAGLRSAQLNAPAISRERLIVVGKDEFGYLEYVDVGDYFSLKEG